MTPKFSQYLNKTILVSIPTLFHDGKCRSYKLLAVDPQGLWLQSDELTSRLLSEEHQDLASSGPIVFVPFAHIAGVLVATTASAPAPSTTPAPTPAPAPTQQPTAAVQPAPDPKGGATNPARTVKGQPADKPPARRR